MYVQSSFYPVDMTAVNLLYIRSKFPPKPLENTKVLVNWISNGNLLSNYSVFV